MSVHTGNAGRRGDKVRSDAYVEITITESGGIDLQFESKVETMYGEQTRALFKDGLKHFGIEHATVIVEDKGALPFVLMARLEGAVRRALPEKNFEPWLPEAGPVCGPSERRRSRRSRLYLPGNEPKYMINAALHSPEGIILDLEDSVAMSEKDVARMVVRNALVHLDFRCSEKMVRINQGQRGLDDLYWIVPCGVQVILIPKVETTEEILNVVARIDEIRLAKGINDPIWLMPIIESAKGAWFAFDIASAHDTVVALAVGLEDYTADIGTQRTNEGRESFWMRSQVVNGARAASVQPIDTVFSDVSDMEGLLESVIEAKSIGFEGKGCIHPRQIEVVHKGFAPTEKEIEKSKKIVLAFEEAERQGLGVVSLGSKMIDPPVVKRALKTVDLAEKDGLLEQNWREA